MKTAAIKRDVLPEMEGAAAYPRKNGEPVFDAPWQRRAFGMVVQLHVSGMYHWDEVKRRLIHEIAAGPCATAPADAPQYYYQWVEAFWKLLIELKILSAQEIETRTEEFLDGTRQEVY